MKKKIYVISAAIVFLVLSICILSFKNNDYISKQNIALLLEKNGSVTTIDSIPSKGVYKVEVTCSNSYGYWDYDNWQLVVEDIEGEVICSVKFKVISKKYFSTYIQELVNTESGFGKIIDEKTKKLNSGATYSNTLMDARNNSEYITVSGTSYITNTLNKYVGDYYSPKTDGFYKLCYSIPSSDSSTKYNELTIFNPNVSGTSIKTVYSNRNSGSTITGCVDYGYLRTTDYVRVTAEPYDKNITFYFSRSLNFSEVSTGIRYQGKSPNNYVLFNNELWRIIGVMNSYSHGQSGKNLVKIIKNDILDDLIVTTSYNNWNNASLKTLLNSTYYNQGSASCSRRYAVAKTCDYRERGINSLYRPMIKSVTWYLGGTPDPGFTAENMYIAERSTNRYSGNPTSTTANILLMYTSDYGYATLAEECPRDTILTSYGKEECATNNWLFSLADEWTLTVESDSNWWMYYINSNGAIATYNPNDGRSVRPTLYLNENVYILDGTGTVDDPYIITM